MNKEKLKIIRRYKIPADLKDINFSEIISLPCIMHIDKQYKVGRENDTDYDDVYFYLKGSTTNHYAGGLSSWNYSVYAQPGDTLIEYVNKKWEVAGKFGCTDV